MVPGGQYLFDIDPFSGLGEAGIDLNSIVGMVERQLIPKALEGSKGVRSQEVQLLGLIRTTPLEKMRNMKIEGEKS